MTRNVIRTARATKHGSCYSMVTRNLRVEYHYHTADRMLVRKWFGVGFRNPTVRIDHDVPHGTAMAMITGGLALFGQVPGKHFCRV